jgi:hypothetical protein
LGTDALGCRRDDVEDFGSDSGEDGGIEAAVGPLVEQDLGLKRKALSGDALLVREFVELPSLV